MMTDTELIGGQEPSRYSFSQVDPCMARPSVPTTYPKWANQAFLADEKARLAGELCIGISNNDRGVQVSIIQRHADGTATVVHQALAPAGDSFARFAIAAPPSPASDSSGLPALPEPVEQGFESFTEKAGHFQRFDADQMRQYARAAIAADRASRQVANKAEVAPVAWRYQRDTQAKPGVPDGEWKLMFHGKQALELQGKAGYFANESFCCWEPLYATPPATTGASTADPYKIPGLGRITHEDDGFVTLQFVDENAAQLFMSYYEPTVDCEQMPPNKSVGASTVLTDERIEEIAGLECDEEDRGFKFNRSGKYSVISFARAIEREVAAQAGQVAVPDDLLPPLGIRNDRDMLNYLMTAFDNEIANCERCGHAEPTKNMDSASFLRDYLAAAPSPAKESK